MSSYCALPGCLTVLCEFAWFFPQLSFAEPLDHWRLRDAGVTHTITALAFGDSQFVLVDEDPLSPVNPSVLRHSADGKSWSAKGVGTNLLSRSFAIGHGQF